MDEIGLKVLEHSNMLKPVSLALLKDEDPSVVCEAIISGMKFFDSILQDLVQQFIRNGKVERWAEEMWMRMIEFKEAILSLIFEPVSVRTKLLALKFLETYVLVFTPGAADTDRLNSRGKERRFNVSWLPSGHPVLDPDKLISEANSLFSYLLDMLKSSNRIPGPLTVTVVNWASLFSNLMRICLIGR
ncbi:unnamed protein product [Amaranthus hypochondriacus]